MKARLPFRALPAPRVSSLCQLADTAVSPAGTISLLCGAVAAGAGSWETANFLFAAGLLLHFAVWFERWWGKNDRD